MHSFSRLTLFPVSEVQPRGPFLAGAEVADRKFKLRFPWVR